MNPQTAALLARFGDAATDAVLAAREAARCGARTRHCGAPDCDTCGARFLPAWPEPACADVGGADARG